MKIPPYLQVRLEVLGPFAKTADGNRYMVFAVDPNTYWTEAKALTENTPQQISRFILSLYFRFGRAEVNVVGQKSEFCKSLAVNLQVLLEEQNLHHADEPVEHAQKIFHVRHGVEQLFSLEDRGSDAGITVGGMALNEEGIYPNLRILLPFWTALNQICVKAPEKSRSFHECFEHGATCR